MAHDRDEVRNEDKAARLTARSRDADKLIEQVLGDNPDSDSLGTSESGHGSIPDVGEVQPNRSQSEPGNWKEESLWAFRSKRVVTPEGARAATILVKSGRILEIAAWADVPREAHLRDYDELILLPGLVDTHVHINEADESQNANQFTGSVSRRDWEGFKTATQAAAAGGYTTLVDMPLNCVPETVSTSALEAKRAAASGLALVSQNGVSTEAENQVWVDWMSWGGVVGNNGVGNEAELPGLIRAGVPGFKCFLVHSGIDGFAWVDEAQLHKAVAVMNDPEFRQLDLPLLAHAEFAGPIERATKLLNDRKADWRSYQNYLASRPDECEVDAIELLIGLAALFDVPIHIVHLSSAKALPMIQKARAACLKITVETCPHYLWFAAENIPDGATEFKCAPPIRNAANREALWQALLEGTIDMVATDHSPCPPEMKKKETGRFDQAWGGIAGLGLALPIVWTGLLQREPDSDTRLSLLAKWLSAEPARLAGLTGKKGALAPGCDADITIFDPDAVWTVTKEDLRFRHKLSPYLGAKLNGRVLETYLRGECIFWGRNSAAILDPKAQGRELRRVV